MDSRTVHAQRGEVTVVDVRTDEEWAAGRIDGARHVPLAELPARLVELDRGRPVVTVCRSGRRSFAAAEFLTRAGYTAHNLEGGMRAWAGQGLPFTADGRPGRLA